MAALAAEKRYLHDLVEAVPEAHELASILNAKSRLPPRVFHPGVPATSKVSPRDIIAQAEQDRDAQKPSVCVIESIDREWMAALGSAWQIPCCFFIMHASNPTGDSLYRTIHHRLSQHGWRTQAQAERHAQVRDAVEMGCIEGTLSHLDPALIPGLTERRSEFSFQDGCHSNCRISYHRVSEYLYLFLVDRPLSGKDKDGNFHRVTLRTPCSRNRGGFSIPQLYDKPTFSAFESLCCFFSHVWHLPVLFETPTTEHAIDHVVLSYFLGASMWWTNLKCMNDKIKHIAFKEIRRPDITINDRLHDLRQDLDTFKNEISITRKYYFPESIKKFQVLHEKLRCTTPEQQYSNMSSDVQKLEAFLMETFQLLMSTITVLDAQSGIEHAKRSARLTQLATIYVPLSFVTGIFGMNVKEINGSALPLWVSVLTLVVVGIITAVTLGIMSWIPKLRMNYRIERKTAESKHD